MPKTNVGRNVEVETTGDVLTITVSLKASGAISKSGKSVVIASTNGNVSIPGTAYKLGLNIYRPA